MRICACFGRGNLRGTWNAELCRFLTKLKSFYKNPPQNALQATCGNNEN